MAVDFEGITLDPKNALGYSRPAALQDRFDAAESTLLEADGWLNPSTGNQELMADLALEGGGVKGIGLVGAVLVLAEAGYRFRGVAGTSAGAIVASFIAALTKAGASMTLLKAHMDEMDFKRFMPEGRLHAFLDHEGGRAGSLVADAAILLRRMGLYPGTYLNEWLRPRLSELGVDTFADLKLSQEEDPGQSLPPGRDYRLVAHVSDITRGLLVRLPWDYPQYGFSPDERDVVEAVRASMSIPFFFEPVMIETSPAEVDVPTPGGGSVVQHYDAGTVTWTDGGMLRNFPINAFDRADGKPPRWPTIGLKLSSLPTQFPATKACESALAIGVRCLRTMMNEWDAYAVDESTAGRTIFIDNAGLTATDFHLTKDQQDTLFLNGVRAATHFVIEMAQARGVPRTDQAAMALVRARRGTPAS